MVKVVYNACHGGFGLSEQAAEYLREKHQMQGDEYDIGKSMAHRLVEVVEALGEDASGSCSKLRIREISGTRYRIDEYDGWEFVDVPDEIEWVDVEP